jgi:hypothetical protein
MWDEIIALVKGKDVKEIFKFVTFLPLQMMMLKF